MSRSYSSVLCWFGLTLAASVMLFHTSDRVNALGQKLNSLNTQIEAEQQSLHVLNAEWVYLANPARIDAAARRHLDLQPTATRRVVAMRDIGSLLPLHDGVEPTTTEFADAAPTPAPVIVAKAKPVTAPALHVLHAALDTSHLSGHINERMTMPHKIESVSTVAAASTDGIGGIINTLSLRP